MQIRILTLIVRLLLMPVSAIFALNLFTRFGSSLNSIIYDLTENFYHIYLRFDTRAELIKWIFAGWLAVYLILESASFFQTNFRFKRLLAHFRYAPIVILLFSGLVVVVYDFGMIEFSKWRIRNYVFSNSEKVVEPDFGLHNNYRHWCGNGISAQEKYLYFDTASEGIADENPYVRSRSLLMSHAVQDWINGGDDRFDRFLAESLSDPNPIVRQTANCITNRSGKGCESIFLSR